MSGHFHMYWNVILADASSAPAQAQTAGTAPSTTHAASTTAAPSAGDGAKSPGSFFAGNPIIFLGLIAVMMYFMMIRPQQQRTKQMAKLLASLKSGDKVVTSSGIVGTVITVKDKTVSLRSADAKMEVTKSSITEILEGGDSAQVSS